MIKLCPPSLRFLTLERSLSQTGDDSANQIAPASASTAPPNAEMDGGEQRSSARHENAAVTSPKGEQFTAVGNRSPIPGKAPGKTRAKERIIRKVAGTAEQNSVKGKSGKLAGSTKPAKKRVVRLAKAAGAAAAPPAAAAAFIASASTVSAADASVCPAADAHGDAAVDAKASPDGDATGPAAAAAAIAEASAAGDSIAPDRVDAVAPSTVNASAATAAPSNADHSMETGTFPTVKATAAAAASSNADHSAETAGPSSVDAPATSADFFSVDGPVAVATVVTTDGIDNASSPEATSRESVSTSSAAVDVTTPLTNVDDSRSNVPEVATTDTEESHTGEAENGRGDGDLKDMETTDIDVDTVRSTQVLEKSTNGEIEATNHSAGVDEIGMKFTEMKTEEPHDAAVTANPKVRGEEPQDCQGEGSAQYDGGNAEDVQDDPMMFGSGTNAADGVSDDDSGVPQELEGVVDGEGDEAAAADTTHEDDAEGAERRSSSAMKVDDAGAGITLAGDTDDVGNGATGFAGVEDDEATDSTGNVDVDDGVDEEYEDEEIENDYDEEGGNGRYDEEGDGEEDGNEEEVDDEDVVDFSAPEYDESLGDTDLAAGDTAASTKPGTGESRRPSLVPIKLEEESDIVVLDSYTPTEGVDAPPNESSQTAFLAEGSSGVANDSEASGAKSCAAASPGEPGKPANKSAGNGKAKKNKKHNSGAVVDARDKKFGSKTASGPGGGKFSQGFSPQGKAGSSSGKPSKGLKVDKSTNGKQGPKNVKPGGVKEGNDKKNAEFLSKAKQKRNVPMSAGGGPLPGAKGGDKVNPKDKTLKDKKSRRDEKRERAKRPVRSYWRRRERASGPGFFLSSVLVYFTILPVFLWIRCLYILESTDVDLVIPN